MFEVHADDKAIIVAIGGSAFCAGLFGFYEGHPILGTAFTVGGLVTMAPISPFVRSKIGWAFGRPALWALATATWLFLAANLGFVIYDHFWLRPFTIGVSPIGGFSPETKTSGAPRIIADVTAEYLMSLYKDVSLSAQGDRLLAPYVGKWIHVSETVADISGTAIWAYAKDSAGQRTIILSFDTQWADQLAILRRDENITALCEITPFVKINIIQLANCELEKK